jgi:cytochrome bd-type quinol oxidase subunit 1
MNYPVWDVPFIGSGLVVAIIAIIHVLISHLAIGGGAFIFVAELWSDRRKNGQAIRDWLHRYATYFLVYTTVFGAVTGVGIWFAIQLANPEGTSLLIHQFVFAWAIEWVFFLGELSILYLYYYGWQKNSRRMQLWLAGLYFVIAWGSLFVINGILAFMLTPGDWTLANTSIFAGFFNPGFLPSLFIRTLVMFTVAGLFAIIVATKVTGDGNLKERMIGFAAKWIIPGALIIPFLLLWYWATLPDSATDLIRGGVVGVEGGRLEIITRYFWLALVSGALIVIGTLLSRSSVFSERNLPGKWRASRM